MSAVAEFDPAYEVDIPGGLRGDPATARLRILAMTWRDLLGTRLAMEQRHLDPRIVAEFERLEKRVLEQLRRELRRHPIWPWLSQFPGLGGGHTALLLAAIGDPHRFPGQKCSVGHYHAPGLAVGSPCPLRAPVGVVEIEERPGDAILSAGTAEMTVEIEATCGCPGVMLAPRPHTGVRSLHRYLGLAVDEDGRAQRKRRGQKTDFNPALKASLLGPQGLADQIVRQRTPIYRDRYEAEKERLTRDRGAEFTRDVETPRGSADSKGAQAVPNIENEVRRGLRPFEIAARARKIAVKAFVGDLLVAWKQL